MGCTIAILLYADDAAIPADSIEDLKLAARIAEEFFNDSQLYSASHHHVLRPNSNKKS